MVKPFRLYPGFIELSTGISEYHSGDSVAGKKDGDKEWARWHDFCQNTGLNFTKPVKRIPD